MAHDPTIVIELSVKEYSPIIIQTEGSSFNIGELKDEAYMKLPSGYDVLVEYRNKICKLKKSLDGLK